MSPREKFNKWLRVWFLTMALLALGGFYGISQTSEHSDMKPVEVTLINAYSSMQKCGSKNRYTCEVFTGRFRTVDGSIYVREMDGFFYHRYVDSGRHDIEGASITLSDYDRGYENPTWVNWLIGGLFLSGLMLFCSIFIMFIELDVEEAQREWVREKEEEARREKYGYR